MPPGAAAGMVAVLEIEMWESTATNPTMSWPAGFSEIVNYVSATDGFQKVKAARKVLTGADSGNYSMSWIGTHWNQAQCTLFSGVDNTTPLDVAVNTAQNSTGTAFPSNALTTANAGCGLLYVVANENSATQTPPTGYTEPTNGEANYLKHSYKIAGAAGSESISGGSLSASTLKLAALIALRAAAGGGGNSTPANPASETDTAQPVGRTRITPAGTATETDSPQPAARTRQTMAAAAVETDSAQTPGRIRTTAAGPAVEADTAQPIGAPTPTPAGQATETDTALPAGRIRITPVGAATETDQALSAARTRVVLAGTAVETDEAQTTATTRATPVLPALETDTAEPAGNPNAILRDLDLTVAVEPARFRVTLDPSRFTATVDPARFRTEIEA